MVRDAGVSAFPALLHGDKPYELRSFDGADFSAEEQTNMALSWALGCYKCVLVARLGHCGKTIDLSMCKQIQCL